MCFQEWNFGAYSRRIQPDDINKMKFVGTLEDLKLVGVLKEKLNKVSYLCGVFRKKYLSWHTYKQFEIAMKKEKIHLEYLLNATSKNILWSAISTPTGLEDWFADKVISDDKIVEFHWGKTELRKAEIIAIRSFSFIRFRWQDDENERDYFEIKMTYNELTSDYVLEITDFAEPDEVDDMKELWESQVAKLRRTCGF
jgi:uncharacterized protein YndB with AHSA1/START domain